MHSSSKNVFTLVLLAVIMAATKAWTSSSVPLHRSSTTMVAMSTDGTTACWAKEQGKALVQRFGNIFEPPEEKQIALENLVLSPSQELIIDSALEEIQNNSAGFRRRFPVRLPSRRATTACFGRILAEMESGRLIATSEQHPLMNDDDDDDDEVVVDTMISQRVHFLQLLQQLSTYKQGVWSLERQMMKESGIENFGAGYL